ncbi:MAG TPA: methyltransferase domain-containing protein [Candidatus Methylomirabilis sp.]|nr:methyltransferase domain-containing protein [Candidatus Methylomirabilis sp.]
MTEWNASGYHEQSSLQRCLAGEHLAALHLTGGERVLDVGCGDGAITAAIADRLPRGSILGVDPSTQMIAYATEHSRRVNLGFAVGDARTLPYRDQFDLVVSFNALHWVPEQAAALRAIHRSVRPGGRAFLELVPEGERTCLEDVIEDTCRSPRWTRHFADHRPPYVHFHPGDYRRVAEEAGFRVERLATEQKRWDFGSRDGFVAFARVTFVEWTRRLPESDRLAFIGDVLDAYARLDGGGAGAPRVFAFYQMEVELSRPG